VGKTLAVDLTELIDERLALCDQIEKLEVMKQLMAQDILAEMGKQGLKQALGSDGRGYRHQESLSCDYSPDGYIYSKRNGLDPIFTAPPKITRPKVIEAYKKQLLTEAQFNRLQKCAGPVKTTHTLVTITSKS
jgi:hypothetical protein